VDVKAVGRVAGKAVMSERVVSYSLVGTPAVYIFSVTAGSRAHY
jgi:hypothetical protein